MPVSPPLDALAALLLDEVARRAPSGLAALAARGAAPEAEPSAELLALLDANRASLRSWLAENLAPAAPGAGFAADPAGWLAARVAAALLTWNQFLPLSGDRLAALAALHARALSAAADALAATAGATALGAALRPVATRYRQELSAFTAALAAPGGPALREVVSAEYTAALQLRILGLDAGSLPEPILDLGCGQEARLVAALRAMGKDARGVDRLAAPAPGVVSGDWLDVPLPPSTFGTVLSHLGFSLHFLHHHLRTGDEARRYAHRYMAILRAVRTGGLFAYAPGLPFVEQHLDPAAWRVERSAVPLPAGPDPLLAGAASAALPWYACRVWRRR